MSARERIALWWFWRRAKRRARREDRLWRKERKAIARRSPGVGGADGKNTMSLHFKDGWR